METFQLKKWEELAEYSKTPYFNRTGSGWVFRRPISGLAPQTASPGQPYPSGI